MIVNKNRWFLSGCFVALSGLGACSSWTETERVSIREPQIERSEAYKQAVRDYKESEHKLLIGWFDNVARPGDRSRHLTVVPDSVDVVILQCPEAITSDLVEEARTIRRELGTRTLYSIRYSDLEERFLESLLPDPESKDVGYVMSEGTPSEEAELFASFCARYMETAFAVCETWDLDGVNIVYDGRSMTQMPDDERNRCLARQKNFFESVRMWREENPDRWLFFEGTPQYLADPSILLGFRYILLKAFSCTTVAELDHDVTMALGEGVPRDRIVVGVETWPLDASDTETGRFVTEEGTEGRAVVEVARWVNAVDPSYTKAGLAVNHLQNDYFNPYRIFQYTREAIGLMNYAPKTSFAL